MPPCAIQRVAATRGTDPGRAFLGGPSGGDMSNVGLIIPRYPTVNQNTRYLIRLASVEIPAGHKGIVTSIRQLLTIGASVPALSQSEQQPITPYIWMERQVTTPFWAFPDGDVKWFLRTVQIQANPGTRPLTFADGYDRSPFGSCPAIIAAVIPSGAPVYLPPNNGSPVGVAVGEYGAWSDMRFPWRSHTSNTQSLGLEVKGPCLTTVYASVFQCDPTTRLRPAIGPGPEQFASDAGLESEDQFWIAFPSARYYRIGAELTVDLYSDNECEDIERCNPSCSCMEK